MFTRKLYYEDSHLTRFTARVLACQQLENCWEVVLDTTAFYPEGGGQDGDTGTLGCVRVLDTQQRRDQILHFCDGPLDVGAEVAGKIDWEPRFYRMQQHSGEHIVSGILYKRYGCQNRGFHMGSDIITIDTDRVVPQEDLPAIEAEANTAVWQNLPVRCWYPGEKELATIPYRSKKALEGPIRIAEFPGWDLCACCGTHVKYTGEIGPIKLFSSVNFRTGSRIEMACGRQAMDILNAAYDQNKLVSQAFSVPITQTGEGAKRMNDTVAELKYRMVGLERKYFAALAELHQGKERAVLFEEGLGAVELRELALAVSSQAKGYAAVFSGNDKDGYGYCLASQTEDLRPLVKQLNLAFHGRGGGKPHFLQGRLNTTQVEIADFFEEMDIDPMGRK